MGVSVGMVVKVCLAVVDMCCGCFVQCGSMSKLFSGHLGGQQVRI